MVLSGKYKYSLETPFAIKKEKKRRFLDQWKSIRMGGITLFSLTNSMLKRYYLLKIFDKL